jgi:hypothetical protein
MMIRYLRRFFLRLGGVDIEIGGNDGDIWVKNGGPDPANDKHFKKINDKAIAARGGYLYINSTTHLTEVRDVPIVTDEHIREVVNAMSLDAKSLQGKTLDLSSMLEKQGISLQDGKLKPANLGENNLFNWVLDAKIDIGGDPLILKNDLFKNYYTQVEIKAEYPEGTGSYVTVQNGADLWYINGNEFRIERPAGSKIVSADGKEIKTKTFKVYIQIFKLTGQPKITKKKRGGK